MNKNRRKGKSGSYNIAKSSINLNIGHYSKQIENSTNDVIMPPYEPKYLIALAEQSDSLKQCAVSMATNICGLGYGIRYKSDFDYNASNNIVKKQADEEWFTLENIFKNIHPLESFCSIMEKVIYDRELYGYAFLEVIRNLKGEFVGIEYASACNIKICNAPNNYATINKNGYEFAVKFNKFVQTSGNNKVYFKEFGDKRFMSSKTGEYTQSEDDDAGELIFFNIHDGYSAYGSPRFSGLLTNIGGGILSEKLNFNYFQDGRINPMAILVSGGQLTEQSIETLEYSKGVTNAYKAIILEADSFQYDEEELALGAVKQQKVNVDIKPLTDTLNSDALFQEYQKQNKEKVRDAFRLPPIYTGSSSDYNRATAKTARELAEEQIFKPDRLKVAGKFNSILDIELDLKYVEMYFKEPKLSSIEDIVSVLEPCIKAGTVTPNMLIDTLGGVLDKVIEELPEEIGNLPFELVKQTYGKGENAEVQKSDSQENGEVLKEMIDNINSYLNRSFNYET